MNLRSITAAEVSFFQEHGWAYLPSLVDGDAVTKARKHAQAAFGEQMELGEIVDRCFYRLPGEDRDGTFSKEIICSATMGSNIIRLLNVSRVRLWTDGPLLKLPEQEGAHDETLYHQDFPGNPYDRSSALTIWIALHDMPAAAGTMRFFNRSHRKGVLGHVFADGVDLRRRCAVLRDEDLSSPLNMRAGDATAHHSLAVHGAPPNRTSDRRWAYIALYMDADARNTGTPGLLPEGISIAPFARFEHPSFPLLPMARSTHT